MIQNNNKIRKIKLLTLSLIIVVSCFAQPKSHKWPLYVYNFGGLRELPIPEQINLVKKSGYSGMAVGASDFEELKGLDEYMKCAKQTKNFEINTVMFLYIFDNKEKDAVWGKVIDRLSGTKTAMWIFIGAKRQNIAPERIEALLRKVVDYAKMKKVQVTLYPHSNTEVETAEEALVLVKKINSPNFKLAVHSCHEIRAGNGNRIENVIENVKGYIGHVTIAGSDTITDFTDGMTIENSTIKPLYEGKYDLTRILKKLKTINYRGEIGFINHQIKECPEVYFPKSKEKYDSWLNEIIFWK